MIFIPQVFIKKEKIVIFESFYCLDSSKRPAIPKFYRRYKGTGSTAQTCSNSLLTL